MVSADPLDHYCTAIQDILKEGGAKLSAKHSHDGLTTDMKGRWTIGAFDTKHANKKETPSMQEAAYEGNAGIHEIGVFYFKSDDETIKQYERLLRLAGDKTKSQEERAEAEYKAWQMIQNGANKKLKGDGPWNRGYRLLHPFED